MPVSLASDGFGQIHFVQLLQDNKDIGITQDNLLLQDWIWAGSTWKLASDSSVTVQGHDASYSVTASITSNGFLEALVSANYFDFENRLHSEIQSFNRYLGDPNTGRGSVAVVMPTPLTSSTAIDIPAMLPTQPTDLTVLYDDNVSVSPSQRNIVGIVIIGLAVIGITLLLIRGRPRSARK